MQKTKTTTLSNPNLPFKIGADPEFLMFYNNKILNAKSTFKSIYAKHTTDTSSQQQIDKTMGYKVGHHGNVGWDGLDQTAELRPTAETNIDTLINHIKELLKSIHQTLPFADLTTLSIGNPIGGHIHIDISDTPEINDQDQRKIRKLIATFLLPIITTDHKICASIRTNANSSNYGQIDDIRIQELPDTNPTVTTLEIRGPSAEWLTTPKIAKATLAYIGTMWYEIKTNQNTLLKHKTTIKNKLQTESLQQIILSGYKPLVQTAVSQIGQLIKTFALYPQFKKEIDFILDTDAVYKEKETAGWNIATGWGFNTYTKQPTQREILSDKKTKTELKKTNIDIITQNTHVTYSDDRHVNIFADALNERITAFQWKLKHEYILFGLKKDTMGYLAAPCLQFTGKKTQKTHTGFYELPKERNIEELITTLQNMYQRTQNHNKPLINPKNGQIKTRTQEIIGIGIPYDIRIDKNIKSLLKLVWHIEKNTLKLKQENEFHTSTNKQPNTQPTLTDDEINILGRTSPPNIPNKTKDMQRIIDTEEEDIEPTINTNIPTPNTPEQCTYCSSPMIRDHRLSDQYRSRNHCSEHECNAHNCQSGCAYY